MSFINNHKKYNRGVLKMAVKLYKIKGFGLREANLG